MLTWPRIHGKSRAWVTFQCASCNWGGIAALEVSISDSDVLKFVSCPVHPEETEARLVTIGAPPGKASSHGG